MNTVTIQEKKAFVREFLDSFQLKRRESVWILNYLLNHDTLLDKVEFTDEARMSDFGIIISAHCSEEVPFRFYKHNMVTTDAEKAFHEIRMNKSQKDLKISIRLNFDREKNAKMNVMYLGMMEVGSEHTLDTKDVIECHDFLDYLSIKSEHDQLKAEIDKAIDSKDRETFISLSDEANWIKKKMEDYSEYFDSSRIAN
jgi:uncharacterized protein YpiB (UPF0302 family)